MNAEELSDLLARLGVPVLGHWRWPGNEDFGGLIRVTDTIHIEVPEEGAGACVVVGLLNTEELQFYTPRTEVRELIYDLVQAGAVVLH